MLTSTAAEGDEFIIELESKVIGKAGCFRYPEVGFLLDPSVWRQGYATEALSVIIERVFRTRQDIKGITADVDPRNTACMRLMGKLGFIETHREENTYQLGNTWADSVYFALPREGCSVEDLKQLES